VSSNTALTYLNCEYNQITTLDVSKNVALESLNCYHNQITELDVSKNAALTNLNCGYNQLAAIDVSKNTALQSLSCYGLQLTTLDVSSNTALTYLDCGYNQLATLDVSKNTALTYLSCGENRLTALDVSKNTALTNLYCGNNQLATLDVSKNTALASLSCYGLQLATLDVSSNTALTNLDCGYNQLATLDISKNTALASLSCYGNQLTTLDVSRNTALMSLSCYYNQLAALDVKNNTMLNSLECQNNKITALDLSNQSFLIYLNCSHNQLVALDINSSADIYNLQCGSQAIDGLTLTQTGDASYPYQFSLAGLMSSEQIENVSGVQGKTLGGSDIETSYLRGIARFASSPASLVYKYDTGCANPSMDIMMSVTVYDSSASVEINADNFPDENFRQYVSNNFDSDSSGSLSVTELQNVSYISVTYSNISSLKGIEYFTALTDLYCYNNKITELDLNNNINLHYLDCRNNKLAALDLGDFTDLWGLECKSQVIDGFTLTETGDTAYPYQLSFSAFISAAQAANVSNVQAKGSGGSEITAAFSGGTAKFSAKPAEISYTYSTGFTRYYYPAPGVTEERVMSMDVTMYDNSGGVEISESNFPDENFRQYISNNLDTNSDGLISPAEIRNTSYIDVTYSSISSLKGIEYFTSLTQLQCYGNQITALDVSKNTALDTLQCSDNRITALDVSKNTNLSFLDCSNNRLESLDVSRNTKLYSLYCSNNQITGIDISKITNLHHFNCSNNQISELDLGGNSSLIYLSCELNQIAELDLSGNENLMEIHCGGNYIYALDVTKNTNLTSLYCYNNQMSSLSLSGLKNLENIYCQNNRIAFLDITSCPDVYLRCDKNTAVMREAVAGTKPTISASTLPEASASTYYSYQLVANGTYPMTWSVSGKLPDGLTLSESGLLSGIPSKAKSFKFTAKASNEYGEDSKSFTITVYEPVNISTASLKDGTLGKSYNATMKAKGTKPITWSAEGLPGGLSINDNGKISGKPTANGDFTVKISAENSAGITRRTFTLKIKGTAPKLSGNLAQSELGKPYSSGLTVTGSTPITWSITGRLPQGLTFDSSTGIISGTPASYAKSGYKITITASNNEGKKSKTVTLKVKGTAPKIKTSKLAEATAGQAYSMTLETSAGSEPIEWSVSGLPSGLGLDGDTITGTPSTEGTYTVKITAANPVKDVSKTLKLKVNKAANTRLPSERMTPENKNTSNTSQAHNDGYTMRSTRIPKAI